MAGALWGLTVPLSKLALGWLGPDWLTVVRFAIAAPLLALAGCRELRAAFTPRVAAVGAVGFGAVIMLQNAGIEHTSVCHAAVVVGVVPVLVALLAASMGHGRARPIGWSGYALALGGVALISGTGGVGASPRGDLLVLGSAVLSALFIVAQPRLLEGRDAAAVTAVEFAAGALFALPLAIVTESGPSAPPNLVPVLALGALSLAGTLLPFWLFAYGQARVPAQLAGAYMNLEPVVGATVGWVAFGSSAATSQVAGVLAVLGGILLSTLVTPGQPSVGALAAPPNPGDRRTADERIPVRLGSLKLVGSPPRPRGSRSDPGRVAARLLIRGRRGDAAPRIRRSAVDEVGRQA